MQHLYADISTVVQVYSLTAYM